MGEEIWSTRKGELKAPPWEVQSSRSVVSRENVWCLQQVCSCFFTTEAAHVVFFFMVTRNPNPLP